MAHLIPKLSNIVSDTGGELQLARKFKELPEDIMVYCNIPFFETGISRPDFILIIPTHGVLVLEVKDYKQNTIVKITPTHYRIKTNEGEKEVPTPFEQVWRYHRNIQNSFNKLKVLRYMNICSGVIFTKFTRKEAGEIGIEKHHLDTCLFKDDIEGNVYNHILSLFKEQKKSISEKMIDVIRGALYPEIRIVPLFNESETDTDTDMPMMRVMDIQQESLARSMGYGHRVINGVAGSGKTIILLHRSKFLAERMPGKILVVCYNRKLADRLSTHLKNSTENKPIEVLTFYQLCKKICVKHNVYTSQTGKVDESYYDYAINAMNDKTVPSGIYDSILVDEAHDLNPEQIKFLVYLLNEKINNLLLLFDRAQNIKKNKFPTFKSMGVQAVGRTTNLIVNYRNTEPIFSYAKEHFPSQYQAINADSDQLSQVAPISARRPGHQVFAKDFSANKDFDEHVIEILKTEKTKGMKWCDMVVIVFYKNEVSNLRKKLEKFGIPATKFSNSSPKNEMVTITTMMGCKGLEYQLVILKQEEIQNKAQEVDVEDYQALLYVATTRATHKLFIGNVKKPS